MAAITIRTDRVVKIMEQMYEKRVEHFEEMKRHMVRSDELNVQYHLGQATGLRRSIYMLCLEFGLQDTDLYLKNDELFEHEYYKDAI